MSFGQKILPVLILGAMAWGWQAWTARHAASAPEASGSVESSWPGDSQRSRSRELRETSAPANSTGSPSRERLEPSGPGEAAYFQAGQRLETSGIVERVLPDDNSGSRHQRFIVRLASGQTLLIAHNIDLAPRVADLARGDTVSFSGIYETNDKGGVVHWTHRDPSGRHATGWIEHKGQRYQ
jgi:hypothetical protein